MTTRRVKVDLETPIPRMTTSSSGSQHLLFSRLRDHLVGLLDSESA
jgi:hypothetical protein